MAGNSWKIHKFGGSSLADANCFARVADIVSEQSGDRLGVVVSAMGGMTDKLLRIVTLATNDDNACKAELAEVGERYTEAARALVDSDSLVQLLDDWSNDAEDITVLLEKIAAAKTATQYQRDVVSGFGEIWSARLLAGHLAKKIGPEKGGTWLDARKIVTVRHSDLGPAVQWDVAAVQLARELPADFTGVAVITGFIAADEEKRQTTLGRNGSDFSAAIFAALTDADELHIWTDVDGVMSADPNKVPEARIISDMSYNEAMELAYFGAKVIHPQTLGPAIDKDIPIVIRNSFDPSQPGTRISSATNDGEKIKGITAVGDMALINVEGSGMIGVPGTADRMFRALKHAGVSVTLISQASSEHSICIAVPTDLAERAAAVIREAFADELEGGQLQNVDIASAQSIIAVVGDGMAGSPGVAARFFSNLGKAGINVRAIAQGSSERNISAVVNSDDVTRALRAVHANFYLSAKTLSIGLIGPGTVGGALLDQLHGQRERLLRKFNLDLRVRGIARSGKMLLGERQVDLGDWRTAVQGDLESLDLEAFTEHVDADHLPHAVIVDCTADQQIADRYADWLARGINVVTPNKKAFSGPQEDYNGLIEASRSGNSWYLYETTVGAALPIIATVRDLIDTGDRIHTIEGIFSGTLAYLFNVYDGSRPFSEIVRVARDRGFTEPDPRDDLSGMDVARKLTIVAREIGLPLEIGQFPVENLVADELRDMPVDEFLDALADYDEQMQKRYEAAQKAGENLRYIARLDERGNASVGLERVPASHAFSSVNLTDNIVQFSSDRYAANPLVIQGPGAGPEVTAAGVFGDLLKLAALLGDGHSAWQN